MLRSDLPTDNSIVHDGVDLCLCLRIRLAKLPEAFIVDQIGADLIALEIIRPGLNHAGRGILGHIVNPAQTHFMFHLRRQL